MQWKTIVLAILATALLPSPAAAEGLFYVDDFGTAPDTDTTDGICFTINLTCTLPAAVEQANATPEAETILLPRGTYQILVPLAPTGALGITGLFRDEVVITTQNPIQLFVPDPLSVVTFQNLTLDGGTGMRGGTLNNIGATVTFDNVTIRNGTATERGGCLNTEGVGLLSLSDTLVEGCSAPGGGAISSSNNLFIVDSIIRNNQADSIAGIFAQGPSVFLDRVVIVNNTAQVRSGGIELNLVAAGSIQNSLIAGNTASFGAALQLVGGSISVSNTTITGNTASEFDITSVLGGAQVNINNVTIDGNSAGFGADLAILDGTASLSNNAIQSVEVADPAGVIDSSNNNVFVLDAGANYPAGDGDIFVNSLALINLVDNGGPLPTMAPAPGSPLVDAGSAAAVGEDGACTQTDARGVDTTLGATGDCDAGAHELTDCEDGEDNDLDGDTDSDDDGCNDGTDLSEEPDCSDGIDNDGDGEIDAEDVGCESDEDEDETVKGSCGCGTGGLIPAVFAWIVLRRRLTGRVRSRSASSL